MDQERWPDEIARMARDVACPYCGAPRSRVMVTVRYTALTWHVIGNCTVCNRMHDAQIMDVFSQLRPKPVVEKVELPAWAENLAKELE